MYPVELTSPRLTVREFVLDDLDDVFSYAGNDGDPEPTRFMTWPAPKVASDSLPFLEETIAAQTTEPRFVYELAVTVEGQAVGGCGLRINPKRPSEAELGYVLHRRMWGQGLIPEASALLINFGFDTLGLHRVAAFHDIENVASRRVLEKLGMQFEGTLRDHLQNRQGQWRHSEMRAILSTDPRPLVGTIAEDL